MEGGNVSNPEALVTEARLITYGKTHPRISWVNRYDWGYLGHRPADTGHFVTDMDPEEWADAWARRWSMYVEGVQMDQFHQDYEKWERLEKFHNGAVFFLDSDRALDVLKTLARPSLLDEYKNSEKSSSFFSSDSEDAPAFGCHLNLPPGEGYEVGRLIYSGEKSQQFPEDDELIAFWYDNRHWEFYNEELVKPATLSSL